MLTIGNLFSGIGGLDLGLERAGLGPVKFQVEIDPFCQKILHKHWPNVPKFGDIKTVNKNILEPIDLLVGGFPCQDISSAGKKQGIIGPKSGLWNEFERLTKELQPKCLLIENVFSGARRWLPQITETLQRLGYRTRTFALSAFELGAPHLRRRLFVLAINEEWYISPSRHITYANGQGELQQSPEMGKIWKWTSNNSGSWTFESGICGTIDGLSNRMDRIKALGNAVVPQCAEVMGKIIIDTIKK